MNFEIKLGGSWSGHFIVALIHLLQMALNNGSFFASFVTFRGGIKKVN